MKKSKFLKSSKELLSRSFNPSKCKTSLRLAASRLKLLRNKKEAQVKQMRREISLLLESGQDQTARIRVEHVIREEKMLAAFDLIGIYCELIVARLPIIESQKICPIDVKEAIASVVYASPRCGDVPELVEVKKQFTEKYGKDFVTAAIELRPECGVSRMLVEKLSALAPDGETKTKILSTIAEEHNVKWEAKSFEQNSAPASDLLSGPTTFVKESERLPEPPRGNQLHDSTLNFTQVDHGSSPRTEVSGFNSALGGERAQFFRGDSDNVPRDRQRWNMNFKDATSAAQAAAESAELASMAARAAAELSSRGRISRQSSTESHKSDDHSSRGGAPDTYMRSNMNEQMDKGNLNNSGGRFEAGLDSRKDYSHLSSLKSRASTDDDGSVVDRYSRKNSLNEVYRGEKSSMPRQQGFVSSHSSISNNGNTFSNPKHQDFRYDDGESSSLGFGNEGINEEASRRSSHGSPVVFDKSDSDSENYGFDRSPTYDEPQQRFQLPLSSQKTREHLSTNTDSGSPKSSSTKTEKSPASVFFTRKSSSSDFPERSMHVSKLDDSMAVTFDEPDGHTSGFKDKSRPQYDQTQLSLSSDDESEETDSERNQGKKFDADPPAKFNRAKPSADQPTLVSKMNRTELNDIGNSSPEREEGLNFAKLTGGFRHKGYNYPSVGKKQFDMSPSKNASPRMKTMLEPKNTKPDLQSTSDTDSSDEEDSLQKSSGHKHKLHTLKTKPSFAASNPMFGSDNSDVDEDQPFRRTSRLRSGISRRTKAIPSNHEKEKYSKLQLRSEALDPRDGMDGKATTSTSYETPKRHETKWNSSQSDNYDQHTSTSIRMEQRPTSSEPQQQFQYLKGNAYLSSSSKVPTKPANSNLRGSLYQHNSEKADSGIMQESKLSAKQASLPQRKTEPNVKTEMLNKTSSNKDSSNQKVSHVHPKLPDYDNFVQFFQKNRS
ncbi:uncharacterized protein LOC130988476 isoform X1 [Salvia miltiorrhiza]|uniref:uncharacterized protein LOC130988476 isoform X1 n=2 Tax=Salvia miltiorrhiza TaxID=226208 RepID=UPI0025AC2C0D|nr:uncharacterized protein LOC130988476 isoform X1 [Salvia miltiorrhiza]